MQPLQCIAYMVVEFQPVAAQDPYGRNDRCEVQQRIGGVRHTLRIERKHIGDQRSQVRIAECRPRQQADGNPQANARWRISGPQYVVLKKGDPNAPAGARPSIPPNALLIFDVSMIGVEPAGTPLRLGSRPVLPRIRVRRDQRALASSLRALDPSAVDTLS